MNDTKITVAQLKETVGAFIAAREWNQFHSPKNLSMAIAAEAAELMEKFMWLDSSASFDEVTNNREEVEHELADVLVTLICFANATNMDLSGAVTRKLEHNAAKYPVEKAKGRHTKYNKL